MAGRSVVITLAVALLSMQQARAFVPLAEGDAPAMPSLRVALIHGDGEERLIMQATYRGDGGSFAWVIPLPAAVSAEALSLAQPAIFDGVEDLTAPRIIHYIDRTEPGCACQNLRLPIFDDTPIPIAVTPPWQSTDTAAYQLRRLATAESANVVVTLTDSGYAPPTALAAGLSTLSTEGWQFVVVEVDATDALSGAPASEEGQIEATLLPVELAFASPTALLPLRALCGDAEETDLTVFAIDGGRTAASQQDTVEMDVEGLAEEDDPATAYDARLRTLAGGAGSLAFVVEYAGTLRYDVGSGLRLSQSAGHYVTRLRSIIPAGGMDSDLRLVSAPSDETFSVILYVAIESLTAGNRPLGLLLLCAATSAALGRRSRSRWALLCCLLLALCVG